MEALAAYGSASEDESDEPDPPAKRSRPAPLPPPPLDGDADDAADAALVRQFPHVDGNFAAHVFLTVAPAPAQSPNTSKEMRRALHAGGGRYAARRGRYAAKGGRYAAKGGRYAAKSKS